ncbi:MAG: trypsin-like peptidase domain-containing protein [Planctomycetaceae bacterium]|nr:trypsin-like peptidase domain-containing protein [Planctomycetaceae bacterium]
MLRNIVFFVFPLFFLSAAFVYADSDVETPEYQQAAALSKVFRNAAERIIPATVKVIAFLTTAEQRQTLMPQQPAIKTPKKAQGDSIGTGILIDPKGIVLTNNHVVINSKEIQVELPDGRLYVAEKFKDDPETDLAVIWLKVPEDDELPFAVFGDSDAMDIGDWVLAIGNPFALDSTVSAGIISAKGRILKQFRRTEFLQTDAAVNPGNSGGPLINLKGEVIGINTAIASQIGSNQGIGFATPSNNAQWIAEQIKKFDKVNRAWIGVETQPLTPWDVKRLGLKSSDGVLVEYALPGSPAEEQGLQSDDVILTFNGQPIDAVYRLQRLTERAEIGGICKLVIMRGGKRYAAEIETKALPPSAKTAAPMLGNQAAAYADQPLGLLLVQSNENILRRLKIKKPGGMIIVSVSPGSLAEKAKVPNGALIIRVGGIETPGKKEYIAARNESSLSDGIKLDLVLPGGKEQQTTVKLQ